LSSSAFKSPKFWGLLWGGLGAIAVLYVIIAASVKPQPNSAAGKVKDPTLLVGEMSKFVYALSSSRAPDIAFETEGGTTTLAALSGKVVLVNLWATWCAPCLEELPSLDELQGALGGKEFQVVAIAADARGPEIARRYLERLDIKNLELNRDPRLMLAISLGGSQVLPVTVLYDRRGREIGRRVGAADWSSPEARALIEHVIAATR
jgi:thiol-disulfide isomerase/thioredoxin